MMMMIDTREQIKSLLNKTVKDVENNKRQAYAIYEFSCEEVERQEKYIRKIKKELNDVMDEVDKMEKDLQLRRQGLVKVSKRFSERDMREQLSEVASQQNELQSLQEKEAGLRKERDDAEIRLHKLVEMREETEGLLATISTVSSFLSSKIGDVVEELEKVKTNAAIGVEIVKAQENERIRISRELHDNVAQDLATVKMDLAFSGTLFGKQRYEEAENLVANAKDIVGDCITNTRQAIFDMHPMALQDQGFAPAVMQLCRNFEHRGLLQVKYALDGQPYSFPKPVEGAMYRIVQEALNNIVKHSGQNKASVAIKYTPLALEMTIIDKGKGIDSSAKLNAEDSYEAKHYGLAGMLERARLIGAKINIESALGQGVTVHVSLSKPIA